MQAFWEWFVSPGGGIVATWVGGIGTTAAFAVAFFGQLRERHDREEAIEQERQDRQEDIQRLEDKEHQSRQVAAWIEKTGGSSLEDEAREAACEVVLLQNTSHMPVYNVVVTLVSGTSVGSTTGEQMVETDPKTMSQRVFLVLPPGLHETKMKQQVPDGSFARYTVEVAFTTTDGKHWARRGTGRLDELQKEPFKVMGVEEPRAPDDLRRLSY